MADLKPGGANAPDEKSGKNGKAKSGEKAGSGDVPAKKEKNALRRRRTIQRRKFLGDLQKAGISKGPAAKKTKKVQAKEEITEKITRDDELKPEQTNQVEESKPIAESELPKESVTTEEQKPIEEPERIEKAERIEPLERIERTREELHPRAQTAGDGDKAVPGDETLSKEENLSAEEGAMEEVSATAEKGAADEEKESAVDEKEAATAEDDRHITYFAHPFGNEENPQETSPSEGNVKTTPSAEEEAQTANPAEEEPQELPAAEEETSPPALPAEEDEIVFGTPEEKAPPMPVGRIRTEETKVELEEKPMEKSLSMEEKFAKIGHENETGEETGSVEVSDVSEMAKNKAELLGEKKSLISSLQEWFTEKLKGMPKGKPVDLNGLKSAMTRLASIFRPKVIIIFLLLSLVAGGGYWAYIQGWPGKISAYVADYFKPKPVVKVEVKVNPDDQRMYGLVSNGIFSQNMGSKKDLVQLQIKLADYFGNRREPKVSGETGISAATFYGALKDEAGTVNQFVAYMKKLEEVQNLYKTDVYAMLDGSTARDKALLDYLDKMKKARADSQELLSRVRTNLDDFNVSYQSLTPDKAKYEKDFFTAMESLQPDKSDMLLKGFIDISQKQSALKARINALSKLVSYYESAIKRLDTRISAIEQNRDAIIQGIRVVDVPGANLDIIIRPSTTVTKTSN